MLAPWTAVLLAALVGAPNITAVPDGLVAIGDVHGDFKTFSSLLRSLMLTDAGGRWCGGNRRLILTGDFLDRGADSRRVMDLLLKLEVEAAAAGGRVTVLLGNHEVMNLTSDLVSTTLQEFEAYKDMESSTERKDRIEKILRRIRDGSPLLRSSYMTELHRYLNEKTADQFFPPGFFGHRSALTPRGRYGSWLLKHDFVHFEENTIFVHGGLSLRFGLIPLVEINRQLKSALRKYFDAVASLQELGVFDEAIGFRELLSLIEWEKKAGGPHPSLKQAFSDIEEVWNGILFHEEGPLWYRGLAVEDERGLNRTVTQILEAHGAKALVIGHTQPRSLRVEARFQDRVILIDTGMNQGVYGGRPSAVIIQPNGKIAIWE